MILSATFSRRNYCNKLSKALAERDSVAAISLATKASTLFAPLPKLADSVTPPAP